MVTKLTYDSGLGQGLSSLGVSIGEALKKASASRLKKKQGSALESALQQAMVDPETGQQKQLGLPEIMQFINKASAAGVAPEMLKPYTDILSNVAKEKARSEGVSDFFKQWQPQNGAQQPAFEEGTETTYSQSSSPINIAKAGQNNMQATMKEEVKTPSGTLKTTEMMEIPGFGKVHPNMISAALRDPREEVRRWGEGAQKALLELEKRTGKQFIEERKYQAEKGKEGEKRIGAVQEGLTKKRMALDMARNAVESGNIGQFSKANLAQRLGIPELQTAEGAQLITASKENLLSNMSRVSARAQNVWFEKRLNDMFPKIGQSKEANLTIQEMLEGEELLDEALVSKYQELEDQDVQKYGYPKGDLEKRARKEIEPLEQKIFERTSYRMRQLEEDQAGMKAIQRRVGKEVMKGTPLTLGMANMYIRKFGDVKTALSAAKKNGYKIPSKEDIIFYEKASREARKEV